MITTPNVEPLSETIPSESTGPGSATEVDSRGGWGGRSGLSRWGPSTAGSPGSRRAAGSTGGPGSWAARRSSSNRCPHAPNCSGPGKAAGWSGRCCTHSGGPGSPGPRRRWSARKGRRGSEAWPPAGLRAPPAGAGLTFPMAAGCGDGVQCGGAGALYIAGGLLRWQEQHKRGRRVRKGCLCSLFTLRCQSPWGLLWSSVPFSLEFLSLADARWDSLKKKKKAIWDIVYLIIEVELQPFHIYSNRLFLWVGEKQENVSGPTKKAESWYGK